MLVNAAIATWLNPPGAPLVPCTSEVASACVTSPVLHAVLQVVSRGYAPLGYHCPLFARKFAPDAVEAVMEMALSCDGLGLGSWCPHNQPPINKSHAPN
jgi:hypothetical protein